MQGHSPAPRNRNAPFLSVTLPRTPACARCQVWSLPTQARESPDFLPTALCSFHDGRVFGSALPASHPPLHSRHKDRRKFLPRRLLRHSRPAFSLPGQPPALPSTGIGTRTPSSSMFLAFGGEAIVPHNRDCWKRIRRSLVIGGLLAVSNLLDSL